MIPALSVRQPWVWLITRPDITVTRPLLKAHVLKDIENRDWPWKYIGPLFLHAGKKIDLEAYDWVAERFPHIQIPKPEDLETGGVVGRAIMSGCVTEHPSPWFVGKYGFVLEAQEPLPFYGCRGQLGPFEVPGLLTRPK